MNIFSLFDRTIKKTEPIAWTKQDSKNQNANLKKNEHKINDNV